MIHGVFSYLVWTSKLKENMSKNYDNWEKLVKAVLRREQLREICHSDSLNSSFNSVSSDFNFSSSWIKEASPGDIKFQTILESVRKLVFIWGEYPDFYFEKISSSSDQVLGKGAFGTSYKIEDSGSRLVVKRLKRLNISLQEFEQQMEIITSIVHENVASPVAYYSCKNEKLVMYEYNSARVSSMLEGKERGQWLQWKPRLRIALGVARGICHIHAQCGGKLVHGNITASNVFLNSDNYGYLSDVGFANMMTSQLIVPTAGYRAPEVVYANDVSQASDVYSFGVFLLELLTVMSTKAYRGPYRMSFVGYVSHKMNENGILASFTQVDCSRELGEMAKMMQVAMCCVDEDPKRRPKIVDVVNMIEDISIAHADV